MVYKDSSEKIKKICLKTFDELKANDIKDLNIEKISSFATYLLIATGTSNRHIKSIADKVGDDLKESKIDILGKEGFESQEWVLIDAGDVLINVMSKDSREHYDLESLWTMIKK